MSDISDVGVSDEERFVWYEDDVTVIPDEDEDTDSVRT